MIEGYHKNVVKDYRIMKVENHCIAIKLFLITFWHTGK